MDYERQINDLLSRPFSEEKGIQLAESLEWYLRQNPCDDTFRITTDIASQMYLNPVAATEWFREQGAVCDCQVAELLGGRE